MLFPIVALVFLREVHRVGVGGRRIPVDAIFRNAEALVDPRLNGLFQQPLIVVFFTLLMYSLVMRAIREVRDPRFFNR